MRVCVRVRFESLLYRNLEVTPEDNLACLLNLGASEKFLVVPGHPHTDARTHGESAHGSSHQSARASRPSGITGAERNDVHAKSLRAGTCQYSLRFAVMRTRHHGERQLRTGSTPLTPSARYRDGPRGLRAGRPSAGRPSGKRAWELRSSAPQGRGRRHARHVCTQRPFASGAARKAARTRRGGLGDEAGMARPHLRAWVRGDKHLVDRLPSSAKPPSPAPTVRKTVSQHRQYCHYRTNFLRKSTLGMLVVKLMEL